VAPTTASTAGYESPVAQESRRHGLKMACVKVSEESR